MTPPDPSPPPQISRERTHWAVEVWREGESVVRIEANCLSGRDISPEDEEAIRIAARNLLGFVGDRAWYKANAQAWDDLAADGGLPESQSNAAVQPSDVKRGE